MGRLNTYKQKRDFDRTAEPEGKIREGKTTHRYVMHEHQASHHHFDLRLETDGVLRSWALPRGPSLKPGEKRMAVAVEDHPLEYQDFEGIIPTDEYGGGAVMLWDNGTWESQEESANKIDFALHGDKLRGRWSLVKTKGDDAGKQWLLIKRTDKGESPLQPHDRSVLSGRSMMQIRTDHSSGAPNLKRGAVPEVNELESAEPAPLPSDLEPQLATLVESAPKGQNWLHEIKLDGYRLLARLSRKHDGSPQLELLTRNRHDWTGRFPVLASVMRQLPVDSVVLDGELVALQPDGSSSFRHLQKAISSSQTGSLVYQVFDLLYLNGRTLIAVPLEQRKQILQELMNASSTGPSGSLRYTDHIQGHGQAFFRTACETGLEGIIAKRHDVPYSSGRNRHWRKVKCTLHESFVVVGYTESGPSGDSGLGSLLLASHQGDKLKYAGKVGTGFSDRQRDEMKQGLSSIETDEPTVSNPPDRRKGIHWVKPLLVVDVAFSGKTNRGRLRHPVFRGIREDIDPTSVTHDVIIESTPDASGSRKSDGKRINVAGVGISSPDRVMFPEAGVTKLDLARYYEGVADWILPALARRPLSLLRCPEGRHKECFFQKHPGQTAAASIPRIEVPEGKENQPRNYVFVESIEDVVGLVQIGVLEFHPWGSRVDDIDKPDQLILDLDPSPGFGWEAILDIARQLRDYLTGHDLPSFVRTTGGKGLHLVVPIQPRHDWELIQSLSRAIAEEFAATNPGRLTTHMSKQRRQGKIFIDYLRNSRGATAVASYSTRARTGAPVAVPLWWRELSPALRSDRYDTFNVRRRLAALSADPWESFEQSRVELSKPLLETFELSPSKSS